MDARFIIEFTNTYTKDADALVKMASVSIVQTQQERVDDFVVCSDLSSIPAPGTIRRIIIVNLTASFVYRFPTNADQTRDLGNTFLNVFRLRLPAPVSEVVFVGGGLCP